MSVSKKSSAEIEREVEAARGRIDATVEELKARMQPSELFDEATRIMSGASNKVLTTAVEQLKENPIPIALIGVGIAWIAVAQARRRAAAEEPAEGYFETYEGYEEDDGLRAKLKARADAAKAKLAETAEKAKASLTDVRTHAAEGVTQARGKAAEYAHLAQEKAGEYGRIARRRFDETLDAEPLVIGALGIAVGAAIGAALPSTPVERRYFGPARAKAAERAKESIEGARQVAQRAYDQVKDELGRQTGAQGEGASLAEKAEAIAGAGVQSVTDDIEGRVAH